MSKQSPNTPVRSRHVFFIDENLGRTKLANALRNNGYKIVTHQERYAGQQGISDADIIADCGRTRTVLLTADRRIETTWAAEVLKAKISAVILANNTDGADKWSARLIAGHRSIIDQLRKHHPPCVLRFSAQARVNCVRLYGKRRAKLVHLCP